MRIQPKTEQEADDVLSAFGTDHYDSGNPDLLVADNNLYIAWEESSTGTDESVFVAKWDVSSAKWTVLGGPLNVDPERTAHDPSLAYDPATQTLYVAFEEYVDGYPEIFVKSTSI